LGKNIEVVEADVYKPDTVAAAVKGASKVFLMSPPGHAPGPDKIIADKCKEAGVKHIVKLSALGGEAGDKFLWARDHVTAENYIKDKGIALTALRPSSFYSNLFFDAGSIKSSNMIYKACGDSKMNWISTEDIGECAAICLTTDGHEGKVYNLTGPDTLHWEEVTQALGDALGRKLTLVKISDEDLRKAAASFLPGPEAVNAFSNMWGYFREGGYDKQFKDAETLLGRKPEGLKSWVQRNTAAFK